MFWIRFMKLYYDNLKFWSLSMRYDKTMISLTIVAYEMYNIFGIILMYNY